MGLTLEKTIKATWVCDWCDCQVVTDSEQAPPRWADASCGGDPCGGTYFCSDNHHYLSQRAWEDGFEEALDYQAEIHERARLEWIQKQENGGA